MLVTAAFLVGGCSKDNAVVEPQEDMFDVTLAGKPSSFTGTVVIEPVNILDAPWVLQGIKKNKNKSYEGVGAETIQDVPAGDWTLIFGPMDPSYGVAEYITLEGKLKFNQTLEFNHIFMPERATAVTHYECDFESCALDIPYQVALKGWWAYGNVYDGETWLYGYGPEPVPNNVPGASFCELVPDQGGELQGLRQIAVISDYWNPDHELYTIECLVYQEQDIEVGASGTWTFSFDAKLGNIAAPSTAAAFVKVLDPLNGYSETFYDSVDMTNIPVEWYRYELTVDVTGLDGQILQFGFKNTTTDYGATGIFYDNVVFTQ
jgi:hypothetical protein